MDRGPQTVGTVTESAQAAVRDAPAPNQTNMYRISIGPEEINELKPAGFPGKIKVIDSVGLDFLLAVSYLRKQKVIGFDTESRPCFSAGQPHYGVSLLQLSGPDKAFLFRIKLMNGIPKLLRNILSSESIIKVGAAVNDDVRGLEKHHKFVPKSFLDLQKIVWEYGIKDKSVKKMAAIILGIRISKTQQLSNWEAETLSDVQQAYAATDAWVCREMYFKLLASEKNPLTPEQMLPNPPAVPKTEPEVKQDKEKEQEKSGHPHNSDRRRRKPRRRRPSAAKECAAPESERSEGAVEGSEGRVTEKKRQTVPNAQNPSDGQPRRRRPQYRKKRPRKPKPDAEAPQVRNRPQNEKKTDD